MYKIFFLVFLCTGVFFGASFQETRYIYAIDETLDFQGDISFFEEYIRIKYTEPKEQSVVYAKDDAIEQKRYFFSILKAIHSDDKVALRAFFDKKKAGEKTLLLPLDIVEEHIQKVEFIKKDKSLKYIKIFMQNKDWIKIEILE